MSAAELMTDGALTIPAAVAFSGLGRTNLYRLAQRGELPLVRVGRRTLVPRRALVELLARYAAAGAKPTDSTD